MIESRPLLSIVDFNKLFTAIAKLKKYEVVINLYKQMEMLRICSPDLYTFSILINSFCGCFRFSLAFMILGKMMKLGYERDLVTLTTLVSGLCRGNRVHDAVSVFEQMVTVVNYNIVIDCLCKNRLVNEALDLFNRMETYGIVPQFSF